MDAREAADQARAMVAGFNRVHPNLPVLKVNPAIILREIADDLLDASEAVFHELGAPSARPLWKLRERLLNLAEEMGGDE